jgi:DNA-binding transcriptional MerR regulator
MSELYTHDFGNIKSTSSGNLSGLSIEEIRRLAQARCQESCDPRHEPGLEAYAETNRERLIEDHADLCHRALDTMTRKNADYATEADVFRNFRTFGGLGILVRMSDKLARLRNFEEKAEFSVSDESLRDTIEDLINYAVIYYAFKKEAR